MPAEPKTEKTASGSGKGGGIKGLFVRILKFALAVLMLPALMGTTFAFQSELGALSAYVRQAFLMGLVSYVILRFFVYDFVGVYTVSQGVFAGLFQFLKPLATIVPYVFPVYVLILAAVYGAFSVAGQMTGELQGLLFFCLAFTFAMHIILIAQDLYSKDSGVGKPDYFFGMSLVYVIDVLLAALFLGAVIKGFSFPNFFHNLTSVSWDIYSAVFNQLFR